MPNKKLYLLPGLAFDHRIFQHLDFGKHEVEYLNWIEPLKKEGLKDYAGRMAAKIEKGLQPICLIGHSFGGILAQEIAALVEVEKTILISSIKSHRENTQNFKVLAPMGLHNLASKALALLTFPFWGKDHGYETAAEQALFKDMVSQHSDHYLKWSLRNLSGWRGVDSLNSPVVHLHGEIDKTFPIHLIEQPVITVKGGCHFMVYKQPGIISNLIKQNLE